MKSDVSLESGSTGREEKIIEALKKLNEFPECEERRELTNQLMQIMTIRETTELAGMMKPDQASSMEQFEIVLFAVYEAAGIDVDIPIKDLPDGLAERVGNLEKEFREFGAIARTLIDKLSG